MKIDLGAIEAAVAKMTPGEWKNEPPDTVQPIFCECCGDANRPNDCIGIVLLRNAAPAILALCRAGERLAEAARVCRMTDDGAHNLRLALTEYDRVRGGMT